MGWSRTPGPCGGKTKVTVGCTYTAAPAAIAASTRILEAVAHSRSFSRQAAGFARVLERADTGRQVQDPVGVADGSGDGGRVDEVELIVGRHHELVAGRGRERAQGTAEHAGPVADEQPHPRRLPWVAAPGGQSFGGHGLVRPAARRGGASRRGQRGSGSRNPRSASRAS
jgi:hypothetical protein